MYKMSSAYVNNKNNYNLTEKELCILDNVWELINEFRMTYISRNKYRKNLIERIQNKYSIDEVYTLEMIVEKMYWNLVDKIKLDFDLHSNIREKYKFDLQRIRNKILQRNKFSKESNVRKSYVYDENENKLLYKYNYPDDFDLIISSIITNRSAYETIMSNQINIINLEINPYENIVEFDYGFPNLNTLKEFALSKKTTRLQNIRRMYYYGERMQSRNTTNDTKNTELAWFV